MSWHGIEGHDAVVECFRRAIARGRLASSFLFVGPPGVGKHTFARKLAQALLCETRGEETLDPCGACSACVQAAAGTHPDLLLVAKPADRAFVPLELLIGDQEHRMGQGLCHDIGLKPYRGGRRVAILDDADHLNTEGANCLLKTLEEPPPRSVLILIGTSPAKQLPTIRSRCQLIRFAPLPAPAVADLLVRHGYVSDSAAARQIAAAAEGSLRQAIDLADADLRAFGGVLQEQLDRPGVDSIRLATAVTAFVDEAGRDAPRRRARLRQVLGLAATHYRQALRRASGVASPPNTLPSTASPVGISSPSSSVQRAAACLDRCLDALEQVDRNANQTTLIECWADDVGRLTGGDSA